MLRYLPLPAQQGQPDHGQEDSTGVCQTLQTVGTVPATIIPGTLYLIRGFPCLSQAFASLWKKVPAGHRGVDGQCCFTVILVGHEYSPCLCVSLLSCMSLESSSVVFFGHQE